jgi:hypothetical protein
VIEYPQIGGLGVVNHLDETVALYDVNDISFYKNVKCFAGSQIDTLSGGCLTQINTLITDNTYDKSYIDKFFIVYGTTLNTRILTPPSNGGLLFEASDGLTNNMIIKDTFIQINPTTYLTGATYSQGLHQINGNVHFPANLLGPSAPYKKQRSILY